jgi:hypothetical protein
MKKYCNILCPFGMFYYHLVYFVFIWYIFSGFGKLHEEKSGNPGAIPFPKKTHFPIFGKSYYTPNEETKQKFKKNPSR